jgi:uncharacterized protein (TIGR03382 family)
VSLRGHTLRVLGVPDAASVVEVHVDGVAAGELSGTGEIAYGEMQVLWELSGLEDRWHEIELHGEEGSGILVDAIDARGEGAWFDDVEVPVDTATDTATDTDTDTEVDSGPRAETGGPPETGGASGCGCGGGKAGGFALLGLAWIVRRRRGALGAAGGCG